MKRIWKIVKYYSPWLFLFLCVDGFAVLWLWLADVRAFWALSGTILLVTLLLAAAALGVAGRRFAGRERAFLEFLRTPDESHEETLLRLAGPAWADGVRKLGETLRDCRKTCAQAVNRAEDYEEYVESWAHEIKTPLSLLTFVLDNRREELPESVGFKLDAVRSRMQESVEQMLYYARLKSSRKDYLFERTDIWECVDEVLSEYELLLEERGFQVDFPGRQDGAPGEGFKAAELGEAYVDRRGFSFVLSQIISNAVKYSGARPRLEIRLLPGAHARILSVKNNGEGVRACDLPHIFEKGFTGGTGGERQKATGMGLYLARGIAAEMNVELEARSEPGEGFEMRILFPVVD